MNNYETFVGLAGSEIDRAVLASGIMPTESRLEAQLKRTLAKGLVSLARRLDPVVFSPRVNPVNSHC